MKYRKKSRNSTIGLKWARFGESRFGNQKAKGLAAKGLRFERRVGEALVEIYGEDNVVHNPWIEFCDNRGSGLASPDFLIHIGNVIVIVECKLNFKAGVKYKIKNLYGRLVQNIYPEVSIKYVQVCRSALGYDGDLEYDLDDLFNTAAPNYRVIQHI